MKCGQRGCKAEVVPNGWNTVCCFQCRKEYWKCEAHGGIEAARRSLRSHKGLCIGVSPPDCARCGRPSNPSFSGQPACSEACAEELGAAAWAKAFWAAGSR